jgi:hypothetical protein
VRHFGPLSVAIIALGGSAASAGPPYLTDDPEPTPLGQLVVLSYDQGAVVRQGAAFENGLEFDYGAAPDLELSLVLPVVSDETGAMGAGNVQVSGKYRFLTQENLGVDIAVVPTLKLPHLSNSVGEDHASVFLPIWMQKDFGNWSAVAGGGCTANRTRDTTDFCQGGMLMLRQVTDALATGVELFHQGAATKSGTQETSLGLGINYRFLGTSRFLVRWSTNLQHGGDHGRYNWYAALHVHL